MNHIYSKVWSHALGAWVVASELASRGARPGCGAGGRVLVLSALAAAIVPAMAQTVRVDERETTADFDRGVHVQAWGDPAPVDVVAGRIVTSGRWADGVLVEADGDVRIESGHVTISGSGAQGVVGLSYLGDVEIRSGTVDSRFDGELPADVQDYSVLSGVFGAGVWASSTLGNVRVSSDSVTTRGEGAYGVGAQTGWQAGDATGTVDLSSGEVHTAGDYAIGVYAQTSGTGTITVESGQVRTEGLNSHALYVISAGGAAVVDSGSIHTTGPNATGIIARGAQGVTVRSQQVLTEGGTHHYESGSTGYTYGINVEAGGGAVVVESGRVQTHGEDSIAIRVRGGASATVDSGEVVTEGDFADGISLDGIADDGAIVVRSGSVTTSGRYADGIRVTSGGADIAIDSGTVTIAGAGANGILALSDRGDIRIGSGSVHSNHAGAVPEDNAEHSDLSGVAGAGVWASTNYGSVEVVSDSIVTRGEGAYGIGAETGWDAVDPSGTVSVTSASVSTAGTGAYGIYANTSGSGAVGVDSTAVQTAGDYSIGVFARSFGGGAVTVASEAVATAGYNSHGIYAVGAGGPVSVDSATASTSGQFAYGILARGNGATVRSGSVSTTGESVIDGDQVLASHGILVEGGGGAVSIESGRVTTAGSHASGTLVRSGASAAIDSDEVATTGDFADGIAVDGIADGGAITVHSGSVTTSGRHAEGIRVTSGGADIAIDSGTVSISGAGANGIVALSDRGDIRIDSGTVSSSHAGAVPADNADHGDLAGVAGAGVWASSNRGDVVVTSVDIATRGEGAYGIGAETGWGAVDTTGAVSVSSGSISTEGVSALGIYAMTPGSGGVAVDSGTLQTSGDRAHGIWTGAGTGAIAIESGIVATGGYRAFGVTGQGAGAVVIRSSEVTTAGELSRGIQAVSSGSDVDVESGSVQTAGAGAYGIYVAGTGDVRVVSGSVRTGGADAPGITAYAEGDMELQAGTVATEGERAHGIDAVATGNLGLVATQVVVDGEAAHGIRAHSREGDIEITTGAVSAAGADAVAVVAQADAGDIHIRASGRVASAQSWAIDASAEAGAVRLEVASGQVVDGGVRLHSLGGSTIDIHGEIIGGHAGALVVSGGAATVNNHSNTIIGSVRLSDGDDLFNNLGTWMASGTSDFGAGSDRLVNTGLFAATAAGTTTLANLGSFVNEGTMDLANGRSGDRLEMPGATFVGGTGSTIRVDVDFATGDSDTLAVGAVQGTSLVQVNDASTGAGFNLEGISIIESDQALDGDEFSMDLGLAGGGLLAYDLEFDPATNRFVVRALPGSASFELIKAAAAGQDFWAKSADAWAARMLAARDGAASGTGSGNGVWLEGHAGGLDFENRGRFDLGGGSVERDMSTDSSWSGVQAGYDRVWSEGDGHAMFGITAGHTRYELAFADQGGRYDLDGANLGVYGSYGRGLFFVHGLAKVDRFSGELRTSQAALGGAIEGASHGARIDAGLRFGQRFWLEPVVGASWVRTRVDDFGSALVEAEFDTATSLQTRAGLRFGGSGVVSGATLVPSLGVYAVDERRGENRTVLWLGGEGNAAVDTPHGNYGRAEVSLTLLAGNAQVFIRGGTDFGGGSDGFNARAGLRWSW